MVVLSVVTFPPILASTNADPQLAKGSGAGLRESRPVLSMYCLLQSLLHNAVRYDCRIFIW